MRMSHWSSWFRNFPGAHIYELPCRITNRASQMSSLWSPICTDINISRNWLFGTSLKTNFKGKITTAAQQFLKGQIPVFLWQYYKILWMQCLKKTIFSSFVISALLQHNAHATSSETVSCGVVRQSPNFCNSSILSNCKQVRDDSIANYLREWKYSLHNLAVVSANLHKKCHEHYV